MLALIGLSANAQFTQLGSKLIGTGDAGTIVFQGQYVAMSADGNTAIVGGPDDSSGIGAAWIYVRSSGVWSQQGTKLVANDGTPDPNQGWSVAISGDGNTAIDRKSTRLNSSHLGISYAVF